MTPARAPGTSRCRFLYGDRLAGKPDATAEFKAGVLLVSAISQDETSGKAATAADDDQIKDLAR